MSDTRWHIVFAESYDTATVARAAAVARVSMLETCDETALVRAVSDADALLVRTRAGVNRRVLERAGRLKVIGRGGVGLDNIDLAAARERGIAVVHTPAAGTDAVADLTVGLMIGLIRHIREGDAAVRAGRFTAAREESLGVDLKSMTLGIVGMGRIGQTIARRCALGFGMTILYNDIVTVGPFDFDAGAVSKEALYAGSDVVSLHVPLTDRTRQLVDKDVLARLKPGAFLINTARGAVVDSAALAEALNAGRLGGAALDVTDPEPLPDDHPLLSSPNTLLTPHIGARTRQAQARMNAVIEDVIRVLTGEPPRHQAV